MLDIFFFKQKAAYEMRISDWSSDVCSSDLVGGALALAGETETVSIIGGAEIFRLFLPLADRIELTEVHLAAEGDIHMPPFDPAHWQEIRREPHAAEGGHPAHSFVTLVRRHA